MTEHSNQWSDDIVEGDTFTRKHDGMEAVVVYVGGGAHNWIDIRLSSGRKVTVSATGLRKKYDRKERS